MLLSFEFVLGGVFFFWLALLTIWFWKIRSRQERLSWGKGQAGLEEVLELVRGRMEELGGEQRKVREQLAEQIEKTRRFLKEPGVVRYNPFPETGGDHSFSMTLVDGEGNGVIMTGLHAREGTRVYLKLVKQGRTEHKLSNEEEKSLKEALK